MSENKLKCGVAGVGYLGQHHARIYQELDTVELAGIYETNPQRAGEISARFGCPVFDSLEALADACEAVSVVVPTDKHHAVALPLLAGGCHLLIEKPICQSLDEAADILAKAKDAGLLVQVGHIEHFNPVMSFLEQAVSQPKYITADRLLRATWCQRTCPTSGPGSQSPSSTQVREPMSSFPTPASSSDVGVGT